MQWALQCESKIPEKEIKPNQDSGVTNLLFLVENVDSFTCINRHTIPQLIPLQIIFILLLYLYSPTHTDKEKEQMEKKMTMNMRSGFSEVTEDVMENMTRNMRSGFSEVTEDVMENIFSRLPAPAFSSAACVSKCWNHVCGRILTKPKFASALSQKPTLPDAVKEVLDKVLAEPIVPHFAIACISKKFSLPLTHQLLTETLGSRVPLITNTANGIIGADVTNELQEVTRKASDDDEDSGGIVLVIGFVPGLKVDAIPLLRTKTVPEMCLDEKFLRDIKDFTAFFSDSASPAGIILFGDRDIDMRPILARMDCALDEETVIVGDASGRFLYRSAYDSRHYDGDSYLLDGVALVFARDMHKSQDIGETQFHVTLSTGITPFGPQHHAFWALQKDTASSWLSARVQGRYEILDTESLLADINSAFDDEDFSPDLYIGVVQPRHYPCGPESFISRASLAFYKVLGGQRDSFIVNGVGIEFGDPFLFYHSDPDTASSSCSDAYRNLAILKEESNSQSCLPLRNGAPSSGGKKVFGGLIFSSYLRETSHPNVESSPFHENFPEVPLAGVFCNGEIGRGSSSSISQEDDIANSARCCLHYHSTVYLALSYTPPTLEY
ncbi:F-box/LRR-repeat protein At5g63520-like [Euphorbia lathyris]|uniref:F-box/LRR-repeat protein At5g63520-like n=1 Tax=Euphorbia lathyris TaxID=212925 RepID=UPI003313B66A